MAVGGNAPDALAGCVDYLARTGQKEKAAAVIVKARAALTPEQAVAALPYCLEVLGRLDEADRLYQTALGGKVMPASVFRKAAEFYLRQKQFTNAAPHLRQLLEPKRQACADDTHWARRQLAVGLALTGSYPQLQEALVLLNVNGKDGQETAEDQRALAIVLSQHPAHRAEAIRLFEELLKSGALAANDWFLLVQLHDLQGDWPHARQRLSELLASKGKTADVLAYAVGTLLKHGEVKEAAAYLAELTLVQPEALRTGVLQAQTARAAGNQAAAVDLLRGLGQRPGADLALVAGLLEDMGEVDLADALLADHVAKSQRAGALLARAAFLGRQLRLHEALDLCETAWKSGPPEQVAGVCVALRAPREPCAGNCSAWNPGSRPPWTRRQTRRRCCWRWRSCAISKVAITKRSPCTAGSWPWTKATYWP